MENKVIMSGMSKCSCCGETLPSMFFISIGNFQRVCVECAYEIASSMEHRKEWFEDELPVLAVVSTPYVCERVVVKEELADKFFNRFDNALQAEGVNTKDAFTIVELTKEQFALIAAEANDKFEANPFLRNSYADHYEIAEMMAMNSTGNETEEDMKKLMLHSWKAVSKTRLDNLDEVYYQGTLKNTEYPVDLIDYKVWVPFPDEEAIMFLFNKLTSRADVQRARANNAEWQENHANGIAYDEE